MVQVSAYVEETIKETFGYSIWSCVQKQVIDKMWTLSAQKLDIMSEDVLELRNKQQVCVNNHNVSESEKGNNIKFVAGYNNANFARWYNRFWVWFLCRDRK